MRFSALILGASLLPSCNVHTHYPWGPITKLRLADVEDNAPQDHYMHSECSPLETKEVNFFSPSQLSVPACPNRREYGDSQMDTDKVFIPRHTSRLSPSSQRYVYTLSEDAKVSFYRHHDTRRANVRYTID